PSKSFHTPHSNACELRVPILASARCGHTPNRSQSVRKQVLKDLLSATLLIYLQLSVFVALSGVRGSIHWGCHNHLRQPAVRQILSSDQEVRCLELSYANQPSLEIYVDIFRDG